MLRHNLSRNDRLWAKSQFVNLGMQKKICLFCYIKYINRNFFYSKSTAINFHVDLFSFMRGGGVFICSSFTQRFILNHFKIKSYLRSCENGILAYLRSFRARTLKVKRRASSQFAVFFTGKWVSWAVGIWYWRPTTAIIMAHTRDTHRARVACVPLISDLDCTIRLDDPIRSISTRRLCLPFLGKT